VLLTLLLWSAAAPQEAPLTVALRATRLERAVPALAEQTGLDLKVDPEIKDLVVIVKVRSRPAMSVLRLVAEQVNASWVEQEDGSLLIVRRPEDAAVREAQQRALERQSIEAFKKRVGAEIGDGSFTVRDVEKFVAALEAVSKPPTDGGGMSLDGPRLASPASLLAKHVLLTIETDDLMRLRPGQELVLSANPNRRQTKANAATVSAFDLFWKNVRVFVDHKSALIGDRRGTGIDRNVVQLEMPSSGEGKALATVHRSNNSISTSVRVYAANGERFTDGFILGESVLPPRKLPARLTAIEKTRFAFSPETALVQKFNSGALHLDGEFAEGSEEARLLSLLREPELRDPLSFLVTDMFFAWADALDLDLVAHLPALFERFLSYRETEPDLARLWTELERTRSISVEERDGVMIVRPVTEAPSYLNDGYAERLGRLNRGLAKFEDRLDATAQFLADTFRATGEPGHGQWVLMKWHGAGVIPQDWHQQGLYFLTLWHELAPPVRAAFLGGATVPLRDLTPAARRVVDKVVGEWAWSSETVPEQHLAMEPTEHFPFGVPLETKIVGEKGTDVMITTVNDVKFHDGIRSLSNDKSLRAVADVLKQPDVYDLHPTLYSLSSAKRLYATRVQTMTLTFIAPDGSSAQLKLSVPLERAQPTSLTAKELVEKYFGGS
jgi:hypothetical protein